ncbi:MAG: hypothetical protein U0N28_06895 [Megasphaera massiliensis]|uniref:hypothetical protein n=1 Tax=Megasphaera TaxID=906 RepID=UPI001CD3F57A|nr:MULTISPECIES: hypothetical protein [Megasphaera]MBS5213944.1 hypothetical protein [Megasphaera sp.]UBS53267.1 hypothetical protein LCQ47_10310 [Megasphaera massiliensis]
MPALPETEDDFKYDFVNGTILKLVSDEAVIVGVIRYRYDGSSVDAGRYILITAVGD